MDAAAKYAIEFVLSNEGGFVDNANDPGGATNFGISLRFLREIPVERMRKYGIFKVGNGLQVDDIRNLTRDQAILIYEGEFWDQAPFAQLEEPLFCSYVFDMCVNHGIAQGIKILQRAIWAVYEKREYAGITDDGILGTDTLHQCDVISGSDLRTALVAERAGYMRLLAAINPKDKEFLNGWLDRCYRIG